MFLLFLQAFIVGIIVGIISMKLRPRVAGKRGAELLAGACVSPLYCGLILYNTTHGSLDPVPVVLAVTAAIIVGQYFVEALFWTNGIQ